MVRPEIAVLKVDGTNCDEEMAHAFEEAGASAEIIHINQLREGQRDLGGYHGLALPGGFAYGDDIRAGKIAAVELVTQLSDQVQTFVDGRKPILGVCNGFQILVQAGLLPNGELGRQAASLMHNEVGHFVCRWVELSVEPSVCEFIQPEDFEGLPFPIQTAHGEGRYRAGALDFEQLVANGQTVFRYTDEGGQPTNTYPDNPSGSAGGIAGICDPSGTIVGLMPHPERSIEAFHPDRSRTGAAKSAAEVIFKNIVRYTKEM